MPAGTRATRVAVAVVCAALVASVLTLLRVPPAEAAIVRPFAPVFSVNTEGAIIIRGNSSMTCPTSASGCAAARAGTASGTAANNNSFSMVFSDVDGVASTFNSSSAGVTLPAGSSVLFAGLYWGADLKAPDEGTAPPTASLKNQVQLRGPTGGYSTVTASEFTETDANSNKARPYQGFADVTSRVAAGGSGTYTVGNIQAARGADRYAGWGLVIAYADPSEPMRNLTVFDGFGVVQETPAKDADVSIPVSGFQTPPSGPVVSRVATLTYEGDLGSTGDQVLLNSTNLSNTTNPSTNVFNSTVSDFGTLNTDRNPAYRNLMGVDADRFDATGVLPNNATSATLRLSTSAETFYPGVITFSTQLYAPQLDSTKTQTDVNGGVLEPGDEIRYSVTAVNNGRDASTGTRFSDSIPVNTTYVPGSLTVNGAARTDASDADTGAFVPDSNQGQVRVNLGTGATGSAGGSVAIGASNTIAFRVRVNADVVDDVDIVNVSKLDYTGAQTGLGLASSSNAVAAPVTADRADLRILKSADEQVVQRGDVASYLIRVINDGPKPARGVVATDTLPPGTTVDSVVTDTGTCSTGAGTVSCQLGRMAVGASAVIRLRLDTSGTTPDPAVDRATVSADTIDPAGGNDSSQASTGVNAAPNAVDDTATTGPDQPVEIDVAANDTDPDGDPLTPASTLVQPPRSGVVTVDTDGSLTYTPLPGWAGVDTFSYEVVDGRGGTDSATVTVTTANAPPRGVADQSSTTPGTPVDVDVLANDVDPNVAGAGQTLRVTAVTQPQTGAGTVTINPDGTVRYAPTTAFFGTAEFTYTVSDGAGGSDTVAVRVLVPDAAPVAADDDAETPYDTPVSIDVLANDTDDNQEPLSLTDVGTPVDANGVPRGTATVVNGRIRYVPPAGFSGPVSFPYEVSDPEGESDTGRVDVVVANDPPTATADSAVTDTGETVEIDVLANDVERDGGTLTVIGTSRPDRGTVTVSPDGLLTYYAPDAAYKGTDSFSYTVSDGQGGTSTGTVTVTVRNAPPVVADEQRTVAAGGTVSVPVLVNDTDPNDDPLSISDFQATTPAGGTITRQGDELVYTPPPRFLGTDEFTYVVSDGDGGTTTGRVSVTVVNTPPVAEDDAEVTDAPPDGNVVVDVLANDTDPNGDDLEISGWTDGIGGRVELVGGRLVYTYSPTFSGVDTFTYTVSDGNGGEATAVVKVTVRNPPPDARDDQASTDQGEPVLVDVLANDQDSNQDSLSVFGVGTPTSGGTVEIVGGQVRYTPPADFVGTDAFTYQLVDARGGIDTATVTIQVNNRGPNAVDDNGVTTDTDTPVDIDVLANDSDADGDPLDVIGTTRPEHGTVTVGADGTVTYSPDAGYAGPDSFTYTVSDGNGGTDTATVSIVVGNAAPTARDDQAGTGAGEPVRVDVLANDTDPNIPGTDQQLRVTDVTQPVGGGGDATVTADGQGVRFEPAPGFRGTVELTYTVADGAGGRDTATVTITVDDAEPVAADDRATTPYAEPVTIDVLDNDSDPNNDPLEITSTTQPVDADGDPAGSVAIVNGRVRYTPPTGFSGEVTFDYTVDDGAGGTDTATVVVVVGNGTPTAGDDAADTDRRTPVQIDVLADDSDPNGDPLTIVGVSGVDPDAGSVSIDDNGTTDPTDDQLVFTPNRRFAGSTEFRYTVSDGNGGTATATVTVDVANAGPDAVDDTATTGPDQPVDIDVTANDTDPDGDTLDVVATTQPQHGTVISIGDGTVTYAPDPSWAGTDTFDYTVSDGSGGTDTATITVETANADPVAASDQAATAPATPVQVDVLDNDTDANIPGTGQQLTIQSVTQPAGGTVTVAGDGGSLTFTPDAAFQGTATFTYTVSDGAGGTATGPVDVTVGGQAPVAVDDDAPTGYDTPVVVDVLDNDSDPNGDPLTIDDLSLPRDEQGQVLGTAEVVDGQVRYVPPAGFSGTVTLTATVGDGTGRTDTSTLTIAVANAEPRADDDTAETDRTTPVSIDVLANDGDRNGDPLRIVGVDGVDPDAGSVSVDDGGTADPGDDRLVFTPDRAFSGSTEFRYTVSDGNGGTATATVTVRVANRAPDAVADNGVTTDTDAPVTIDVLANDTDPDGDDLTVTRTSEPAGGTVVVTADGSIRYTPDPGFAGTDSFTYTISDGSGGTDTATVTLVVRNAPPVAADDQAGTGPGTPVRIAVLDNDSDANIPGTDQELRVTEVTQPGTGGTVSVTADGLGVRFEPAPGFRGTADFTYTVADGAGGRDTATVTVTVDDAEPVAADDRDETPYDTPVSVDVLGNDTDPNGDPLTVTDTTDPVDADGDPAGTVSIVGDRVRYTPPAGFSGAVTFDYTIDDGAGGTDTATVTVTVGNAEPDAVADTATTDRRTPVTIDVLADDTDPNGDPLAIVGITGLDPGAGSVSIDDNGTPGDSTDDQLVFTPNRRFAGTTTFRYTISDGNGGTDTATVTVQVDNAGPTAVDDTATTGPDQPLDIDVTANDADPDGDGLDVVATTTPQHGSVIGNGDGTVTYTPDPSWAGTDTFDYVVSDGNGGTDTATVTVRTGNAPPAAAADQAATAPGTAVDVPVLANDSDPNIPGTGQQLTVTAVTQPAGGAAAVAADGRSVTFTPDGAFQGTATFTYTVSDGAGGSDTARVEVTVGGQAPVAVDDRESTPYGTAVTVDVLANDTDPNGDPLTITGASVPRDAQGNPRGSATVVAGGIRYDPPAAFSGTVTFTYTVEDATSRTDTATVTVEVGNAPPTAQPDSATTDRRTPVRIDVLADDTDPNGDELTIVGVTGVDPDAGSVDVDDNGTPGNPSDDRLVFTPDPAFSGTTTFRYTVSDGNGGTDTATVTVQVDNAGPDAVDDAATTDTDIPVGIDVLSNDTDPDGDELVVTGTTRPAHGTVVVAGDGTVTYTPDAGYAGPDSFTYTISDGSGGTDTATVDVTVGNAAPVATDDEAGTGPSRPVRVDVLDNDSDPNIPATDQRLRVLDVTQPAAGGTAAVSVDGQSVRFEPAPGFAGRVLFSYTVGDGAGGRDTATVAITVSNADPVAVDDQAETEAATPVTIDVLDNDFDPNGDDLDVVSTTQPVDADGNPTGTVRIVGDQVRYTPPPGFAGEVTFEYTIDDGDGSTSTATATITVVVANAVPDAEPDSETTDRRTPVSVDVLANDSDPNGDLLTIVGTSGVDPDAGTVTVDDNDTDDPADDRIVFTPDPGFAGTTTFRYTISDGNGGTSSATVTIQVDNAGPDAVDDQASTGPDQPVDLDVTANDTDPDGDGLEVVATTAPSHGSVTIVGGGTVAYTPDPSWAGSDTFDYTVSDGNGGTDTATVTVTTRNADPAAADDQAATAAATAVRIDVLDNDTDPNIPGTGQQLDIASVTQPAGGTVTVAADGQSVTFTPDAGFQGTATFDYTVADGAGGTDTATVEVTVGGRSPVAVDDQQQTPYDTTVTVDVLGNDTDPNGDPLTITGTTLPRDAQGQVRGTVAVVAGGLRYDPPTGFSGEVTFDYTVEDDTGRGDTATVTVVVGNAAPTARPDAATTDRRTPVRIDVLADDSDPNGDPLTIVGITGVDPAAGSVQVDENGTPGDPSDDVLVFSPDRAFSGTTTFRYTISDGNGGTDTAAITVQVDNDGPDAVPDDAATDTDTSVDIDVLGNDTDADGDPLTVTGTTQPDNGTVVVQGDGTITYTPDPGFTGADSFRYTIEDGDGGTDTATVSVTVRNADPLAADDEAGTGPGSPVRVDVLDNDTDANIPGTNQQLRVLEVTQPANGGTATVSADGLAVRFVPAAGFRGTADFTYTVGDGAGGRDTATVTVTVGDAEPVAADDRAETPYATPVRIDVLANDSDPNGDVLDITSTTQPVDADGDPTGSVSVVGAQLRYVPPDGFSGEVTFDYTIDDGAGGSDTATVTVVVGNGPPDAESDAATTDRRTPVAIDVLTDDTDPNGDPLTIVGIIGVDPDAGSVTVDDNGTPGDATDDRLVFTPNRGFAGTTQFDYRITDGNGGFDQATVTVNVDNAGPTAVDDDAETGPAEAVTIPVTRNDTDPDGDSLSVVSTSQGAHGTVTIGSDGAVVYTPDSSWAGEDTFTYVVGDGNGGTDSATVTVTTHNARPDAVDDATGAAPDTAVQVEVLDNDSDANIPGTDQELTVESVTQPAGGTVTVAGDGRSVTFTPDAGFQGTVTFDYTVSDGAGGTDTATVEVTVGGSAPVAVDDERVTPYDSEFVVDVLANDFDPNGDPLSITGTTLPRDESGEVRGTVAIVPGGVDYDPPAGFSDVVTFDYTIDDGTGAGRRGDALRQDSATVTITVQDGPPIARDDSTRTEQDTPVSIDALANDDDPDDAPDVLRVVGIAGGAPGSVITVDDRGTPQPSDDEILYAPAPGFVGTDVFTYTIADPDGERDDAEVTVVVGEANLPPVFDDVRSNSEQTIEVGERPRALQISEPDGDDFTVTLVRGELPPGVTLEPDGTFGGEATTPGVYTVLVRACDDQVPPLCSEQELTITVLAAPTTTEPTTEPTEPTDPPSTDPPSTDPPSTDPPTTEPTGEPTSQPTEPTAPPEDPEEPGGDPLPGTGAPAALAPLLLLGVALTGLGLFLVARGLRGRRRG